MVKIGWFSDVIFDCSEPERLAAFWGDLLGLEVADRDERYVGLQPTEAGVSIGFQAVPEPKTVKNRIHVDLRVPDWDSATRQIEAGGGRHIADVETWRVMADPEGNEFCLLQYKPEPSQAQGQA